MHGTLIASDPVGDDSFNVYAGKDGKVYVHFTGDGTLHRDVAPGDLGEYISGPAYLQAMHALGRTVAVDIGLPEAEESS